MSGKDDEGPGGELVEFPRIFMPGSFDAPSGNHAGTDDDGDQAPPVGSMPRMFGVGQMAPPLALTMPGVPTGPDGETDEEDGSFALPMLGDPENPTARGALAVAVALMTAMGVAAAQGMWHRARHRQALADQSRAAADRSKAAAAGARASRSSGGSGSLLRSPSGSGSGGSKGSRAFGGTRSGGKGTTGHGSTGRSGKTRPPGVDAAHGPHRPPKRDKHAPKAGKDGKPTTGPKGKPRKVKGGTTPKPSAGAATKPAKPSTAKKPGTAPMPKLTWQAPKGAGKSGASGPKRWTAGRPGAGTSATKRAAAGGKGAPGANAGSATARKLRWKAPKSSPGKTGTSKSGSAKPRQWTTGRKSASKPRRSKLTWKPTKGSKGPRRWTTGRGSKHKTAKHTKTSRTGRRWHSTRTTAGTAGGPRAWTGTPPPPPPGFEGMRPPPGADRRIRVTAERVDRPARPQQKEHVAMALAGAPAAARLALPAASRSATTAPSSSVPHRQEGARFVSMPVRTSTQYGDAELTVHDVIDADADMAEEIVEGVDEARAAVDGCEVLLTRLEALHAKVVELKVPGVLEGLVLRLMEKTGTVRAKAEAIAENLPRAAEAISVAGSNAEARHKPLADAVRDAGHTRPAEREYHNE